MSLSDPELELIDPTPNVHALFVQFDIRFFWGKLASRAVVVRWSKRMYSCAGICRYEGRKGLCDIALSEPLLKLRPRKDLIETLLHEMIHAYLFIVGGDRDREGHGPLFKSHMHRINKMTGLNITIYHSFHDEVKLYQTHWWRCTGPCQFRSPYFGIVRRTANRAPGPSDSWWKQHLRTCGGTFVKIKEPEKKDSKKGESAVSLTKITKFFPSSSNVKTINDIPQIKNSSFANNTVIKTLNNVKTFTDLHNSTRSTVVKANGGATVIIPQNNINKKSNNIQVPSNSGFNKSPYKSPSNNPQDVSQFVRNIWANKKLNFNNFQGTNVNNKRNNPDLLDISPPPLKVKKIGNPSKSFSENNKSIDDKVATSILKDIYGKDFILHKKNDESNKIGVTHSDDPEIVSCPLCNINVKYTEINSHLDECLNMQMLRADEKEPIQQAVSEVRVNKVIDLTCVELTDPCCDKIVSESQCPCCDKTVSESMEEHLENCLSFCNNNTAPENATSNTNMQSEQDFIESFFKDNDSFVDELDESGVFNETGTKFPCPCCLQMIEETGMNEHLDQCLLK